ncbi:MAG: Asp-tRNA(Asn)/Glu-tRNA(Gln) amidotransferase subunit GatB [Chloroflexi bacterium]|nr:Asp-tRNA(Asn)/Glu-tRNA(Gln) amidotransferase subunit GatB [Chloroflexota bacterium]
MVEFETIIGLEVHAQLSTQSKMFCGCNADYADAPPNTHVCPVCLGLPGVLPTINRRAVEFTVMTALALHCTVSAYTRFDRKNYPYPDLMKGYQISQSYYPIGHGGWLALETNGETKRVGISNVHLEEDVAKLLHQALPGGETCSLVDVNRSGVPLMEIVGDPDLRSPEEARQYLITLRRILQFLGVSTANMEEGSFRCDANISIRARDGQFATPKVEVKNMNSFRSVYRALEHEAERLRKVVAQGRRPTQETRGWVEEEGKTVAQRSKEYAHDYRYFPEPDLPPLVFAPESIEHIRTALPELPEARRDRFMEQYGLSLYDASLLTNSKAMADYFEACLQAEGLKGVGLAQKAKMASNWLLSEFSRLLNAANIEITATKVTPAQLVQLLDLMQQGVVSGPSAKQVFEEMFQTGKSADRLVAERGLGQISGTGELEELITGMVAANPQAVADYRAGKKQSMAFLVGKVMQASKGRANPKLVNELMKKKLEGETSANIS